MNSPKQAVSIKPLAGKQPAQEMKNELGSISGQVETV
jgi:hypothetical protein